MKSKLPLPGFCFLMCVKTMSAPDRRANRSYLERNFSLDVCGYFLFILTGLSRCENVS